MEIKLSDNGSNIYESQKDSSDKFSKFTNQYKKMTDSLKHLVTTS